MKSVLLYVMVACLGVMASFYLSIQIFPQAFSQAEMPAASQGASEPSTEVSNNAPAAAMPAPDQATAVPTMPAGPSTEEVMAQLNSENYTYDPTGKRDPFKAFEGFLRAEKKAQLQQPKQADVISEDPLQRSDLSAFTVVGILWDVKNPRALVKDSKDSIYTVGRNTKIGLNDGYVAMIREGEIVVVETFHDDGQPRKQTKILSLGKQ